MAFVLRESFKRMLDWQVERLKQELQIQVKRHELTLKSQIEYKERQLSELYGPIYAMLKRGRALVQFWKDSRLTEVDQQFWTLAYRTNEAIEQILLTKSHLIEGDEIPKSFVQFLTHVPLWHAFNQTHHLPRQEEFPEAYYPEDFEKDIYMTTRRLKKELHELYQRFGLTV